MKYCHVAIGCPDLDAVKDQLEAVSGCRPAGGGLFEKDCSQNAVLGTGEGSYLGFIAPCGEIIAGSQGEELSHLPGPVAYAVAWQVPDMDDFIEHMRSTGLPFLTDERSRTGADGVIVRLRRLFLANPDTGKKRPRNVPFFIDWLDSPHPSQTVDTDIRPQVLILGDPEPSRLSDELGRIGLSPRVARSDVPALAIRFGNARFSMDLGGRFPDRSHPQPFGREDALAAFLEG